MYILFENFRNIDSYIKQRMMLLGVKGEWVHCEIIFDEVSKQRASSWGSLGVEILPWENIKKPKYFELYPLPSENWKAVYDFMEAHKGSPYDKLGVIGMVYQLGLNSKDAKFCSEICFEALKLTSVHLPNVKPSSVSPLKLRRYIINNGIQKVPSTLLNN